MAATKTRQTMRLFKVVALRAHNTTKGRKKAPDRVIYIFGSSVLQVKDCVERGRGRIPGIKYALDIIPVGIRDMVMHK